MAKMSKQQIELYAVMVLAVVAAVLAYYRFVRTPSGSTLRPGGEAAKSGYEIPGLPDWFAEVSTTVFREPPPYSPPSRDLFAPVRKEPDRDPSQQTNSLPVPGVVPAVVAESSQTPHTSAPLVPAVAEPGPSGSDPKAQPGSRSRDGLPVLTGTMQSGGRAYAILDGRIVGVGGAIGEYTVGEIRSGSVVLLKGTTRRVLRVGE